MNARERLRTPAVLALLLALGSIALFAQTGTFQFLRYDDDRYVTENEAVRGGLGWRGVGWAFRTFHASNWHPLTWLSHMTDVTLFGLAPGPHHLVSACLHGLNAAILFLALVRMTGAPGRSACVAALFAVHPLHVQSVAWVAERKDVLSTLFAFLTLLAHARYAERPGPGRYLWVVAALAMGLLAKPMLVTIPFVLLLLDGWPLGRFGKEPAGRVVLEKVPLLLLAVLSSAVTLVAQRTGGAVAELAGLPLATRLANAVWAYGAYLGKTVWPRGLAAFYPFVEHGVAEVVGAAAFLAAVTVLVGWRARRGLSPWLAVGWLWYLGTLVPVIGLVQVGGASMADRYTYVALVGVFLAVTWQVGEVLARSAAGRRAALPAALLVVLVLAGLSFRETRHWRDQETLFRRALAVTTDNWVARANLSDELARQGRVEEAIAEGLEAVRIRPRYAVARYNLGVLYHRTGQLDRAEEQLRETVRLDPEYGSAWIHLGGVHMARGRLEDAEVALLAALRIRREDPFAWFQLGALYGSAGLAEAAVKAYQEALRRAPGMAAAWNNLGVLQVRAGRLEEALVAFREAVRLEPGNEAARRAAEAVAREIAAGAGPGR